MEALILVSRSDHLYMVSCGDHMRVQSSHKQNVFVGRVAKNNTFFCADYYIVTDSVTKTQRRITGIAIIFSVATPSFLAISDKKT